MNDLIKIKCFPSQTGFQCEQCSADTDVLDLTDLLEADTDKEADDAPAKKPLDTLTGEYAGVKLQKTVALLVLSRVTIHISCDSICPDFVNLVIARVVVT